MNRTARIATIAAGGVVVVGAIAIGMSAAGTGVGSGAVPSPLPSAVGGAPSASASTSPSSSPSSDSPAPEATVDPYYGDVVVAASTAEAASFPQGLTVELLAVTATTASSSGVGSTGGAAVDVSLRVTNTSSSAVALSPVVNAYAGDDRVPLTPDHESPIGASIASAAQSTGSYTFAIDDTSTVIWITVSTGPDSGLVVFEYRR